MSPSLQIKNNQMKDLSISNKIVKAAYDAGYRVDHVGNVVKDGIIKKTYILNRKPRYADFPMYVNNRRHLVYVHKLCAYQKYGDALFESQCVRHLDGNSLNNAPSNIAIGSFSDNMYDIPNGVRSKRAIYASSCVQKLNKHNHKEILDYYKKVRSYTKVMEKFNISSKGTVSYIIRKSIESAKGQT